MIEKYSTIGTYGLIGVLSQELCNFRAGFIGAWLDNRVHSVILYGKVCTKDTVLQSKGSVVNHCQWAVPEVSYQCEQR